MPESHFDSMATIRTNLVKDHKAMQHTKFQVTEPSGSEEEDFLNIIHVFLWFKHRTSCGGAILDQGAIIRTNI